FSCAKTCVDGMILPAAMAAIIAVADSILYGDFLILFIPHLTIINYHIFITRLLKIDFNY
ncbi:hypothetical protein JDS99_31575, partial [Bacillus cereus group sp. N6]|uniref:hypothetical protein n=1 Tax=Bacillus cereus group sp. N6 TaxID=2794583 RepID=UPI0018F4CEFD